MQKDFLRNSILATLVYYDIFDLPLNMVEVHKYLINPGRLTKLEEGIGEVSLEDVRDTAESLKKSGLIEEINGNYSLNGRSSIVNLRYRKKKVSQEKIKKCLRWSRFFTLIPFLKAVFLSGSLAVENGDSESDYDVFVVAGTRRLYTVRAFLWLISSILGVRRKPGQVIAPDKFCFNHFITDKNLNLKHESIFTAQTLINFRPVLDLSGNDLLEKFYLSNLWIKNYVYNFQYQRPGSNIIKPDAFSNFVRKILEMILSGFLGDKLESKIERYQREKIESNPITRESGGRIVYNKDELEFHPRSFERIVISRYSSQLRKVGIIPFIEEKDSGLRA